MTADLVAEQRPEAPPTSAGASGVATAAEVAARTLRQYARSPQLLVSSVIASATFIVLFRYIFGGAIELGQVPYVDFLIPGMVLTSVLITGTGTAVAVAEDADKGLIDRLRSLPVPRLALLAGRALGDLVINGWGIVVTAGLGFLVGFRLHGSLGQAILAFFICLACGFAFLWLFICLGLVSGSAQAAQGTSYLIYPLIFVSSAYVPVNTLPGWMQPIAEHQPITVMANAVRSLALGDPALAGLGHTTSYWVSLSLIWSAALVVVLAPVAVVLYRRAS
jgi:ABC transporter DrrB family efflux protein